MTYIVLTIIEEEKLKTVMNLIDFYFYCLIDHASLKNTLPNPRSLRFSSRCFIVYVLHLYLCSSWSYYFCVKYEV